MEGDTVSDVFTISARKCRRCGGILTSKEAVEKGFGHTCLRKEKQEKAEKEIDERQLSFFERNSDS